MANDTVNYDYQIIEQCVSLMKRKAGEIADDVNDLNTDVDTIMVDWEGTSATSYESLSKDLVSDLGKHNAYLEQLKVKLEHAASEMNSNDGSWAKRIAANGR